MVGELDLSLADPGDGLRIVSQRGLAEDRVVAATIEGDDESIRVDRHGAGILDESSEELFRVAFSNPFNRDASQR